MATKHPRLMVVLDRPVYRWVQREAHAQGISLSLKARDCLRAAYEEAEDRHWTRIGEERLRTFRRQSAKTHAQVWSRTHHA